MDHNEEKINLSKLLNIVGMNSADISTFEKPIIGTQALATCFGVLLYDENQKIGIVAHFTHDIEATIIKILKLIDFDKEYKFKYIIFPGYYSKDQDPYNTKLRLESFFNEFKMDNLQFIPFNNNDITANALLEGPFSHQFAFDTRTGKFVTDKVLFGIDYIEAQEKTR